MQSNLLFESDGQRRPLSRRTFMQYAGACTAGALLTSACKSNELSASPASSSNIACYGDSLTDGIGGTRISVLLTKNFPDRIIENYGISGQNALEIATRQGGQPLLLTLRDNGFAESSAVPVTNLSAPVLFTPDTDNTSTLSGTLDGVKCILTRTATGIGSTLTEAYTVTPLQATKRIIAPDTQFYLDSAQKTRSYIQTLWLGRNNVPNLTGVLDLINSCVLYLDAPRRFVVVGVLSAVNENAVANKAILEMNATLARNYPNYFVSSTPPSSAEMAALNYAPAQQDLADIAAGFIPRGMRVDGLHLTTVGSQLIATRIAALIKANNW